MLKNKSIKIPLGIEGMNSNHQLKTFKDSNLYDIEQQYLNILKNIVEVGEDRPTRSGFTKSIFGESIKFDLRDGFPLLTTKKMFIKGVIEELMWFLSGSTNVNDLPVSVQHWWKPWASSNGDLGPIYGEQYRKARWYFETCPRIFDAPEILYDDKLLFGVGKNLIKFERGLPEHVKMLKGVWKDMLSRCYNTSSKGYKSYGAKGVHVDPEWFDFEKFMEDVMNIPGWYLKKEYPSEYSLDKDIKFSSNRYSKDTCIWASHTEQSLNTSTGTPFYATSPDGVRMLFASLGEMNRKIGLNISAIHRCLNGKLHTHHGWSNFKYFKAGNGDKIVRFREVDQLKNLIAEIKNNPTSRRHMINLWNSPAMEHANLPCCHGSVMQFYVSNEGILHGSFYQRSADWFIGVPVNLASYSILMHILAIECGLKVGTIRYNFGDAHIYHNHFDQVAEQLSREPRKLPTMKINPDIKNIFDFKYEDFELIGYDPHPTIKAPVAV